MSIPKMNGQEFNEKHPNTLFAIMSNHPDLEIMPDTSFFDMSSGKTCELMSHYEYIYLVNIPNDCP